MSTVLRCPAAKAGNVLGWQPRGDEETIVATAESLPKFGLVKPAASA